jgi:hypothetical protein
VRRSRDVHRRRLRRVTDGFYQAMFLTVTGGVVVDAPPTIGRNLQQVTVVVGVLSPYRTG